MAQSDSKRLQVFVSSTVRDLKDPYQAVIETILSQGHHPAGMGLFGIESPSALDLVYQWIDLSDVYVLLLGNRYGEVQPAFGKSLVHLEYEYAIATETPILALVIDNSTLAERVQQFGLDIIESNQFGPLEQLRNSALAEEDLHLWNRTEELETILHTRLPEIAAQNTVSGWVRPAPLATAPAAAPSTRLVPVLSPAPSPLSTEPPNPTDLAVALQTLHHLSGALDKTVRVVNEAEQATHKLTTALADSESTSDSMVSHLLQLQETVADGARTSKRLAETAQQMTKIVQLISQVASRTNVIALNTSIEVSRLGSRGAGFTKIADDLRQLASHTAKVSQAVEQITTPLQAKVNLILTTLGQGIQQSLVGAQQAQQTQQALAQLAQATAEIEQAWTAIAATTTQHQNLSAQTVQTLQPADWQNAMADDDLNVLSQALQKLMALSLAEG